MSKWLRISEFMGFNIWRRITALGMEFGYAPKSKEAHSEPPNQTITYTSIEMTRGAIERFIKQRTKKRRKP